MSEFDLPSRLPAMVLPHCAFLPHGLIPLYIFENRYRSMLRYALENERMFCLAMRVGDDDDEDDSNSTNTRQISTAGMIRACVRNPDGTFHLLLQGLRRVRFTKWANDSEFPMANVEWLNTEIGDPDRCLETSGELLKIACKLSETHGSLCQQLKDHLHSLSDPESMVDIIAYNFIRCPSMLQTVLESLVLEDRIDIVSAELNKLTV